MHEAARRSGRCVLLPGGIDQYLELRHAAEQAGGFPAEPATTEPAETTAGSTAGLSAAETRQARKDLARLESRLARLEQEIARLHEQMASTASDYTRLAELQTELSAATAEQAEIEEAWLTTAESLG